MAAPQCLPARNWEPIVVARFVEHVAAKYRVDRDRIYLIGFSMGADGTWQTAVAYPELFAAIVPISGGGDPNNAASLINVSVWAFHGTQDKVIPVETSERMIETIRNMGGRPRLTILPNEGHDICKTVCARTALWEWLFEQRRSQ